MKMNKKLLFAVESVIVVLVVVATLYFFNPSSNLKVSNPSNTKATTTPASQTPAPVSSTASSAYLPRQVPLWGEYHVNAPNALMLVDSQGRRTGKDPATGILYREIPGTSYGEESGTPGHRSGELFTSNLPDGQYTLYILGGQTGAYWLDASHYGQQDQTFRGNIQKGSMIAYTQNYDSANLTSSTFSFSSTASSTASITSVPPNNLPPPPVP